MTHLMTKLGHGDGGDGADSRSTHLDGDVGRLWDRDDGHDDVDTTKHLNGAFCDNARSSPSS